MLELERILENKPVRPPMISTLALRWQSACPQGPLSLSGGGPCGADSPKHEDEAFIEEVDAAKDAAKQGFCLIQWRKESLDNDNKFLKVISSKTSLSSNTMTTTISKQEQQQHLQQQQQQQQYVQLQQQALLTSDSVAVPIAADLQFDTLNNNNQNNNTGSPDQALPSNDEPQKRRSLLNFKSLDFHLKSLYSGLRSHSGTGTPPSQPNSSIPAVDLTQRRMPYLRVESVDPEEPRGSVIHPGHSPSFLSPYSGAGAAGAASLQLPSSDGARQCNQAPVPGALN